MKKEKRSNTIKVDLIALRNYRSSVNCYLKGLHTQHRGFIDELSQTEASMKLKAKVEELAENIVAEMLILYVFLISIEEASQDGHVDIEQLKLIQPDEENEV